MQALDHSGPGGSRASVMKSAMQVCVGPWWWWWCVWGHGGGGGVCGAMVVVVCVGPWWWWWCVWGAMVVVVCG